METNISDRIPPQNLEAEQAVLGAVLLDKEAIVKVADILTPEDFYDSRHGQIYSCFLELFERRSPIDLVTVTDYLESKHRLEEVGGASFLSQLVAAVPTAAHIVNHAAIVSDKATLRRLISAATQMVESGYGEITDVPSLLDRAEQSLFQISQKQLKDHFIEIKSVLAESFDRIDDLHKHKGQIRGVPSGFRDLDNLLAGFQKSDLVIIAARPSMGKTALALNIAAHAAVKEKIPVGIFSLEMSKEQLVDRLLTIESMIDSWRLRTGNLQDEDFPKLNYAMGMLSEARLYIDDSPLLSAMEVRTKARRLQAEHGLGLIIIDYLQLMEGRVGGNRGGFIRGEINRVQEVSDISRSLKALARELKVPVLAISQLSRAVEQRPGKKIPQLSDLRESGSIEQDADVVMFIYRDEYYNPETEEPGIARILIRKHRNGPTGEIELIFKPEYSRFGTKERELAAAVDV